LALRLTIANDCDDGDYRLLNTVVEMGTTKKRRRRNTASSYRWFGMEEVDCCVVAGKRFELAPKYDRRSTDNIESVGSFSLFFKREKYTPNDPEMTLMNLSAVPLFYTILLLLAHACVSPPFFSRAK
jgi:hypothetical protein